MARSTGTIDPVGRRVKIYQGKDKKRDGDEDGDVADECGGSARVPSFFPRIHITIGHCF